MQYTIDPEFESYLWAPDDETQKELEYSLQETGGAEDKIKLARFPGPDGKPVTVLLDGHRRVRACEKLGLPPPAANEPMNFSSREHALAWMDSQQFCRRNLNKVQRALVISRIARHRAAQGEKLSAVVGEMAAHSGEAPRNTWRHLKLADAIQKLDPTIRQRALEWKKTDIERLAVLPPEQQLKLLGEVDAGETTLRNALHGTPMASRPDRAKRTPKDEAHYCLGKLQDAIKSMALDRPNKSHDSAIKKALATVSILISGW